MRYLLTLVLLSLWVGPAAVAAGRAQNETADQPCRVRRIYVAELGGSDEAERFRKELRRQLKRRHFSTAERAEGAEAVLTGKFSAAGDDRSGKVSFEGGELKDAGGARLWHGSFYFTRNSRLSVLSGGAIKGAAGQVASNLRDACR